MMRIYRLLMISYTINQSFNSAADDPFIICKLSVNCLNFKKNIILTSEEEVGGNDYR